MNNVIRINENILRHLIKQTVHDYIKAITSYGGDKYDDYEQFLLQRMSKNSDSG